MKNIFLFLFAIVSISCSNGQAGKKEKAEPVDTTQKTESVNPGLGPDEKPIAVENSWDGTYHSYSNELTIKTISQDILEVKLCISSEDCEMGCSTSRFSYSDEGYNGEFKDFHPDAIFIISIENKKVSIETDATDLEDYLGANCFITGEYK